MLTLDDLEQTVKPLSRRRFLTQLGAVAAAVSLPQLAFANEPGKKSRPSHCQCGWRTD